MKTINICRCCLNIGCYRDISTEYFWAGKSEVYEQMFLNTFDIKILFQEGGGSSSCSHLICEECIKKLRQASDFKDQVLRNEPKIKKFLSKLLNDDNKETHPHLQNKENKSFKIKEDTYQHHETKFISDDEVNKFINNHDMIISDDDIDHDTLIQLKEDYDDDKTRILLLGETNIKQLASSDKIHTELLSDLQINTKAGPKRKKQRIRKRKTGETNIEQSTSGDEINTVLLSHLKHNKTAEVKKKKPRIDIKKTEEEEIKLSKELKLKNMVSNTVNLLWYSKGAVLFWTRQNFYQCFMCKREFIKLQQLRDHVDEHPLDTITSRIKMLKTYRHVDISELSCRICGTNSNDFMELSQHLTEKHDVEFTNDGYILVPYKTEDGFNCFLCKQQFKRLCLLKKHMNTHYSHNVCEICGDSFLTPLELYYHIRHSHKPHNCVDCGEKFEKTHQLRTHKKIAHKKVTPSRHYCLECTATFKYNYLLNLHRIEMHGWKKPNLLDCKSCERKFNNKGNLNLHVRSVHLKEKNFACDWCPARFFTKYDLTRHHRSHSSERYFQCDKCLTNFKAKESLRRHIKKLHSN